MRMRMIFLAKIKNLIISLTWKYFGVILFRRLNYFYQCLPWPIQRFVDLVVWCVLPSTWKYFVGKLFKRLNDFYQYLFWPSLPFVDEKQGNNGYKSSRIPRGLFNLGNTCYFNSTIQPIIQTYVLQLELKNSNASGELIKELLRFYDQMLSEKSCAFNPDHLHNMFGKKVPRFVDRSQHDSHECLRYFLDELRKEERTYWEMQSRNGNETGNGAVRGCDSERILTVVDKVFGGHMVTVYTCGKCNGLYTIEEQCLDISLAIRFDKNALYSNEEDEEQIEEQIQPEISDKRKTRLDADVVQKIVSIEDCLCYFTRMEHIHQQYLCKKCNEMDEERKEAGVAPSLTDCTKQTLIQNPPAVLTLHLKRFDLKSDKPKKCLDRIKYNELLDLAPYCSVSQKSILYSLYAVVVHSGSLESGHYIAYVKVRDGVDRVKKILQKKSLDCNLTIEQRETTRQQTSQHYPEETPVPNQGAWYRINDSSCHEAFKDDVLDQEAYLLFYERLQ